MQRLYNPNWMDDEAKEALNNYKKLLHTEVDWHYPPLLFQFSCNQSFVKYDLQALKNKLDKIERT